MMSSRECAALSSASRASFEVLSVKPIQIVHAPQLPPPGGHYSHALIHNELVYVSGQLGRGPGMSDAQAGDIRIQARRALNAIDVLLRAAGSSLPRLLKVTVYVPDVLLWPVVNEEYAHFMGEHRPARAVVPTSALHYGALVEIDAVAALLNE